METQEYNIKDNHIVSSLKVDQPYYLHGYLSIEKEMDLIKNRSNERAFIADLYNKEKFIRSINQDKHNTRTKEFIKSSPLFTKSQFRTVDNIYIEDFIKLSNFNTFYIYIFFSIIFGICLGLVVNYFHHRSR